MAEKTGGVRSPLRGRPPSSHVDRSVGSGRRGSYRAAGRPTAQAGGRQLAGGPVTAGGVGRGRGGSNGAGERPTARAGERQLSCAPVTAGGRRSRSTAAAANAVRCLGRASHLTAGPRPAGRGRQAGCRPG